MCDCSFFCFISFHSPFFPFFFYFSLCRSGGFRGVYSGLSSVLVGSAPGSALFFSTYETSKALLTYLSGSSSSSNSSPWIHMTSASIGEIVACLVRVPTEIVKQRMQAQMFARTRQCIRCMWNERGLRGFYRGYFIQLIREIPFSFIQFPIWEQLKKRWSIYQHRFLEFALCSVIEFGCTPLSSVSCLFQSYFSCPSCIVWLCCWLYCCCTDYASRCGQNPHHAWVRYSWSTQFQERSD